MTARMVDPGPPSQGLKSAPQRKHRNSIRSLFIRPSPVTPPHSPTLSITPSDLSIPRSPNPDIKPLYPIGQFGGPPIPQEVFDCIVQQLKFSHLQGPSQPVCDTCLLRDLWALMLVTKKWAKPIQKQLYKSIYLHGPDSTHQLKPRFGSKPPNSYGSRIKLLRRTLRSRQDLAAMVVEIKMPAYDLNLPRIEIAAIHSTVATVVMACPNLERLVGFYPVYEFGCGVDVVPVLPLKKGEKSEDGKWGAGDRLWKALSTRKNLKEMVWMLSGDNVIDEAIARPGDGKHRASFYEEKMLPITNTEHFISYHENWQNLRTMVLHGMTSTPSLAPGDFSAMFAHLPELTSLYISHFHPHQFGDINLPGLPPLLTSLRLESLPGVTDRGLSSYFSSYSRSIKKLALINLEIMSLPLIIKLLGNLSKLDKFTILQNVSPTMPEFGMGTTPGEDGDFDFNFIMHPLMANRNLRFLHWDCMYPGEAEQHLTDSIREGGFPGLRKIRAPSDENGALQAVCKPRSRIELPGDKFRSLIVKQTPQKSKQAAVGHAPTSPDIAGFAHRSEMPMSPTFSTASANKMMRHLPTSRAAAQKRLENAQIEKKDVSEGEPAGMFEKMNSINRAGINPTFQMKIVITNYDAVPGKDGKATKDVVTLHGFLGTIGSKIDYYLLPDVQGSESAVVGVGDILELGWEYREDSEGCTGAAMRSNMSQAAQSNRLWWHRERIGWKKVALDTLF